MGRQTLPSVLVTPPDAWEKRGPLPFSSSCDIYVLLLITASQKWPVFGVRDVRSCVGADNASNKIINRFPPPESISSVAFDLTLLNGDEMSVCFKTLYWYLFVKVQ